MKQDFFCRAEQSLLEAMLCLSRNGRGIVFFRDADACPVGFLTDGEIRRLLLAGVSPEGPAAPHLRSSLVVAYAGESHDDMLSRAEGRIRVLPIVDEQGRCVDVFEAPGSHGLPVAAPDLRGREFAYLVDAFLSSWISSSGFYLQRFEEEFARVCQCQHGVAVCNGTAALHLALAALDIGPGDEVIVPDLTFAATANAVLHAGATPVIVDIDPHSWCLDPEEFARAVTPRTRAVIPVHLYGQPCDMAAILQVARAHNLYVIEDCAEAHGAAFDGRKVGSLGDIGCFSFFGNKILTTGEGGMCVTSSPELAERLRLLRDHGMSRERRYWHDVVGYNYRMTNLQAAIGLAQVERFDQILETRRALDAAYRQRFGHFEVLRFQEDFPLRTRVPWMVSLLVGRGKRDEAMDGLRRQGVDSRRFFFPLSEMPLYAPYVFSAGQSLAVSRQGLNLPTFAGVDVERIPLAAFAGLEPSAAVAAVPACQDTVGDEFEERKKSAK